MTATRQRNAVLFFIVPSRRRFAIIGDEGIHAKVGPEFWESTAAVVSGRFRQGDFTAGIVEGIEKVSEQLASHFPFDPAADVNELSDDVDFAGRPPKG
jgi:uncharacterized membrane protein